MTSLAILALFAAAAFRLMPSVNRLIGGLGVLRQSIASAAWIQSDFAEFSEFPKYIKALHEPENGTPTPFNTLFLKDVSYTHPGASQPAVNNINLTIKHGDTLAIVGKSGAGKTTLADLVLGLNQPSAGKIWLNGEDLSDNMASWHAGLGYVPQDISFFDDTIEHNVAVGEKVIDRDCLYNALHLAQIDEFMNHLNTALRQ